MISAGLAWAVHEMMLPGGIMIVVMMISKYLDYKEATIISVLLQGGSALAFLFGWIIPQLDRLCANIMMLGVG